MPKLAIACGGRDYADREVVRNAIIEEHPTLLIEGKAPGADTLAGDVCYELFIPYMEVPALWGPPGQRRRKAGYDRNVLMMKILLRLAGDNEKIVIAFPGDRGTKMMMDIADQNGVEVRKYGW